MTHPVEISDSTTCDTSSMVDSISESDDIIDNIENDDNLPTQTTKIDLKKSEEIHSEENKEETKEEKAEDNEEKEEAGEFECNICFDQPSQPVVTSCGHLYCWGCIYRVRGQHKEIYFKIFISFFFLLKSG